MIAATRSATASTKRRRRETRSNLHRRRPHRQLSAHRRGAERAIEQRKQHEPGEKSAEMGDPGHRHLRETKRLSSGAENQIRPEPDQYEDKGPALDKNLAEARGRNRLDLRPTD